MIAIILTGGASRRFGAPKALATTEDNEVFYKKIKKVLKQTNLFDKIVISTSEDLKNEIEHSDVVVDLPEYKDKGPLAGIYSVMSQYDSKCYFVIACDMPFITEKAISQLYQFFIAKFVYEQIEIAGYTEDDKRIPTLAFYSHHLKKDIKESLDQGNYRMKSIYENQVSRWLDVKEVNNSTQWYQNINYKSELKNI